MPKVQLAVADGSTIRPITDLDEISVLPRGLPVARVFTIMLPAASGVVLGAADSTGTTTLTANPDVPRSVDVTFPATWDAGAILVKGIDQFGEVVSELFEPDPGGTAQGECIFATVTGIVSPVIGDDTAPATVVTGDSLGFKGRVADSSALLFANNVAEPAEIDNAHSGIRPSTSPNGMTSYGFIGNAL